MISSLCESCVKKEIASKSLMLKENKSSSEVFCFFYGPSNKLYNRTQVCVQLTNVRREG